MAENRVNFGSHITLPGAPERDTDAAPKGYIDGRLDAMQWESVTVATTEALELSGASTPPSTLYMAMPDNQKLVVDDYTIEEGDSILLWQQEVKPEQNGIYICNYVMSGSSLVLHFRRRDDADSAADFFQGKPVFVQEQTVTQQSGGRMFRNMTKDPVNPGTVPIRFRMEDSGGGGGGSANTTAHYVTKDNLYKSNGSSGNGNVPSTWWSQYRVTHGRGTQRLSAAVYDHEMNLCSCKVTFIDNDTVELSVRTALYPSSTTAVNGEPVVAQPLTLILTG